MTAFGTCSSVATIPTNMEAADDTGISSEVREHRPAHGRDDAHGRLRDERDSQGRVPVRHLRSWTSGTGQAILAIIVAVFSSVAMSGIPGGGGTGELVVCTIFFPDQLAIAYPIAIALGNLVDPPATMVNAAGDYVVSFIVSPLRRRQGLAPEAAAQDTASAE